MGTVAWDWRKSLWFGGMALVALLFALPTASPSAIAVCAVMTVTTLCLGHSVGIHRGLIHQSYRSSRVVRFVLVWLGVLVGLGGPLGLLHLHQTRDAQQNLGACHDYFGHRRRWWVDYWWNLHCRFEFSDGWEPSVRREALEAVELRFLEATWRWWQVVVGAVLFAGGGWRWVVWGVFVRVAVSTTGHWLVGYVAHNDGERPFEVVGAAVQGTNSWLFGALAMGEGWHNNHHAFPRSARFGLEPGQLDPGYACIVVMERLGWVTDVLRANENVRTTAIHAAD